MNALSIARRPRRPAPATCRTVEPLERRLCLSATLTLSGTFTMETIESPEGWSVGPDMADTLGHENGWTCTLYDANYDHSAYDARRSTSVFAGSFDFQFSGPDADMLNAVAAQQFYDNGTPFLIVESDAASGVSWWNFGLGPYDPIPEPYAYPGVFFSVWGHGAWPTDAAGYPLIQTMAFPAGSTTKIDDDRDNGWGGWLYQGTLTSYDDPVAMALAGELVLRPPAVSTADLTVAEGDAGTSAAAVVLSLSRPATEPVTVSYATYNAAAVAGRDYVGVAGSVTIGPGQSGATVLVPILGDVRDEFDEGFYLQVTDVTNARWGDKTWALATIIDDDAPPAISINDVSRAEGGNGATTAFVFIVRLSAPSEKVVTASFGTGDGTARMSDGDYLGTSGSLTFAPGETSKTITVLVKGDKKKEADETFFVNLFGITDAIVGDDRGVGTILNDDPR